MLITESQMGYYGNNGLNLGLQLLNEMYFLDAEQSAYTPAMVPVVENSDLGRVIVRLEDLQNFCEANGISDMGYAVQLICEADGINPSYVGFSIASNQILSDPDLANLSAELLNEGVCVVATPVNENDAACLAVDMAMYQLLETGYDTMLEAIAWGDYDTFFNEADDNDKVVDITSGDNVHRAMADERSRNAALYYERNAKERDGGEYTLNGEKKTREKMGTLKKIWDKVKSGVNISRDWIAKQLDKLNAWMRKIIHDEDKMETENVKDGKGTLKKRGWFSKIKEKIARVIEVLTRKLHDLIAANRMKISDTDKALGMSDYYGWSDTRKEKELPKDWDMKSEMNKYR